MKLQMVDTGIRRHVETDNYQIFLDDDGVPHGFEHNVHGEYDGGGLWFDGIKLVDYDGVTMLGDEVIEACERMGYNMDWAKDD